MTALANIVLVHGAWADGSSWSGVIRLLQKAGYNVAAPQFPLTTLDANVVRLRQVLAPRSVHEASQPRRRGIACRWRRR